MGPQFPKAGAVERLDPEDVCPICLGPYTGTLAWVMCPTCERVFHESCVEAWLRRRHTCPFCRSLVKMPCGPNTQSMVLCDAAEVLALSQSLGEEDSDTESEDSEA